jgi:type IV pilus assembly protein PilE
MPPYKQHLTLTDNQLIITSKEMCPIEYDSMHKGFSLIELLIVLAITAILLSFAYPNFQAYVVRTHRIDGQMALFDLANRMEVYFSKHHSYALSTIGAGGQYDVLSSNLSPQTWYELSIMEATAAHFTLQATPREAQALQDKECQSLRLNDQGIQTVASGPAGTPTGSVASCWS